MLHLTDTPGAAADSPQRERPSWPAIVTGLNAALAISYIACKPPSTHTLSLQSRLLISAFYVLLACLAGAAGTWIALPRRSRSQYRSLVLLGARGWVFFPAMMMFLREGSVWTLFVVVSSATLMAVYLSRLTAAMMPSSEGATDHQDVEKNIFISQLRFKPVSWTCYAVAACLYGAVASAVAGRLALVTLLLGAAVFLLVLQLIAALTRQIRREELTERSRPYSLVAVALCCAFIALSVGAAHSAWQMTAFHAWRQTLLQTHPPEQRSSADRSAKGDSAIVLWPVIKKEKIIPSPPVMIGASPNSAKPWAIPFYGPYWYFKIPGETPGPRARTVHGDPLKVNVLSTDSAALLMEAHQTLSDSVDLDCCREMQIVFKNDVSLGASEVGLFLTDSHTKGKTSQNLGIKYVALSGPEQTSGPMEETVSFPLPRPAKIRRFDRITVILLPHHLFLTAGRKISIERFVMIPR